MPGDIKSEAAKHIEKNTLATIDYCGYHTHNPNRDVIFRPNGTDSYLLLLILAPMTFYFGEGNVQKAKPGACILYTPGTMHHYQADDVFFISYVHFFCTEETMKQFSIPSNTLFYPIDTEELNWIIKKIHMEFTAGLTDGSLMISYYLMQLLILLNRSMDGETGHQQRAEIYPELLALRDQMLGNCSHLWTIAELCDILGVGKSQLYKYYTSYFHATPKEELIKARLQKAKYLLLTTSYTVKEIAYSSGFENINHFNRIFKSTVGCSPGTFRHGA